MIDREPAMDLLEHETQPLEAWRETHDTLHMWTQIVGKVRLALTPLVNHWWNTTLYVTPRGLATGPMPYGDRYVGITFDFVEHDLLIESSDGRRKVIPLIAQPVAEFYRELMISEAGHYRTFLELAETYVPAEKVRARWKELLHAEAEIMLSLSPRGDRIH